MAFTKSITLTGGVVVPAAYHVLNEVTRDKITGKIGASLVIFRDEATRRDAEARSAEYNMAVHTRFEKAAALEALKPVQADTAQDIAAKEIASITARAELSLADAAMKQAEAAMTDPSLATLNKLTVEFNGGDVGQFVNGDQVDVALIYQFLMSQPAFADAVMV